jgi:DNA-binding transcriptional regulator YhcF (GntR family)
MKLYQQLAHDLSDLIRTGALKPGDRVPSAAERAIKALGALVRA